MDDLSIEWFKIGATIGSPFLASYLTFKFGIKGKRRDTDLQKKHELNNVLSHLLIVRNYLNKLDDYFNFKYDEKITLPVPRSFLSILFKSGILNDNCFKELEVAITSLRKYDPFAFYNLEGLGNRLEFLRKAFFIPFFNSNNGSNFNKAVYDKYLTNALNEVQEHMMDISKSIDYETQMKVEEKLERDVELEREETKQQILKDLYEAFSLLGLLPAIMSFEEFVADFHRPENQEILKQQLEDLQKSGVEDALGKVDLSQIMEVVAVDPTASVSSIMEKLSQAKLLQ